MCVRVRAPARASPRLEGLGGGAGQAVPQGEDRQGPDSSQRGECPKGWAAAALSGTQRHSIHKQKQQQHPSSPIWTESFGTRFRAPTAGGGEGLGQRADEVSVRPEGRLADTRSNSGPASGRREVSRAERRFPYVSLPVPRAPGLPSLLPTVIAGRRLPRPPGWGWRLAGAGRQ